MRTAQIILTLCLLAWAGGSRATAQPAEGNRVQVDAHGVLTVNGRQLFVRGWYGGPRYGVSRALQARYGGQCDSPFANAFARSIGMEAERLDPSQKGNPITRNVRPSGKVYAEMLKRIAQARTSSDAWWYYLADEPEARNVSPVYLKYQYDFIKTHDPNHPVMIITRDPQRYADCCDVLNPHPYLNPTVDEDGHRSMRSPKLIRNLVRAAKQAQMRVLKQNGRHLAVWCTPQAFSYAFKDPQAVDPTFTEFRCMVYTAIVNGAKGLTPFMYASHFASLDLRMGVNFIYETLTQLEPFLIAPQPPLDLHIDAPDDSVDAWATTVNGQTIFIAVNLLDRPVTATITSAALSQYAHLHGYRETGQTPVRNGALTLQFQPYQVHLLSSRVMDDGLASVEAFQDELDAANAALHRPDNLLDGRGREIETNAYSWGVLSSPMRMFRLFDGINDADAYVAATPGPGWITLLFPTFTPTFQRIRVYGWQLREVQLSVWRDAQWQKIAAGHHQPNVSYIDCLLPAPIQAVKIKLNLFTQAAMGSPIELYEVEMYGK